MIELRDFTSADVEQIILSVRDTDAMSGSDFCSIFRRLGVKFNDVSSLFFQMSLGTNFRIVESLGLKMARIEWFNCMDDADEATGKPEEHFYGCNAVLWDPDQGPPDVFYVGEPCKSPEAAVMCVILHAMIDRNLIGGE